MDDTPKKILMFNHEFPPIGGGGGWVSHFLGKHFAAAGHDVHLITSKFRDCPKDEKIEGFHVHRVRALRKNPDICAVHEMLTYAISCKSLRFEIREEVSTRYRPSLFWDSCGWRCVSSAETPKRALCRILGDVTYRAATLTPRIISGYTYC